MAALSTCTPRTSRSTAARCPTWSAARSVVSWIWPCATALRWVGLIDSGGARIQEGVKSLGGYAEIFRRNARYSGCIPQISVMLGPCAGGAAYSPAITDVIIMVKGHSYMFLTGPDVIKAVTGEIVDAETLGGCETHMSISGTSHFAADSDIHALDMTRDLLSFFPSNNVDNPPAVPNPDPSDRMDEELNTIVPIDPMIPYVMHEVVERIVDQGSWREFQPTWACNALTGLARMGGQTVGIVGQEPSVMAGVVDIDAADKICRFVRTCDCFNIPILTLIDSPGFLPGVDQEHRGIIRHGAKVLYAYAEASVPKVSIVTRKAYGGAYVVMSSKYLGTDVTYAWPSAEIAVMGAEGAVNILFKKQIEAAEDKVAEAKRLAEDYPQALQQSLLRRRFGLHRRHHRAARDPHQGHRSVQGPARQVGFDAAAQARQHARLRRDSCSIL